MSANKLLAAAILAIAIGAPVASFVEESKMPQPIPFAEIPAPFLHRIASKQIGGSSELGSLEQADDWLNSPPLTATALRGKVVVVDFWTYTCVNWLRTLPYLRAW